MWVLPISKARFKSFAVPPPLRSRVAEIRVFKSQVYYIVTWSNCSDSAEVHAHVANYFLVGCLWCMCHYIECCWAYQVICHVDELGAGLKCSLHLTIFCNCIVTTYNCKVTTCNCIAIMDVEWDAHQLEKQMLMFAFHNFVKKYPTNKDHFILFIFII